MAFKRVATEGATTDGREISRGWLEQMAANYDPAVYGARISLEHIRGVDPAGMFRALGDIKALKAEENADGKIELFADIDPTDELKAMVKARQKVYTSIEVEPNFAKTNTAYLTGLGVTDSPASLGVEMLQFSANQGAQSPLASRKHSNAALFSACVEMSDPTVADRDFEDAAGSKPSLSERISAMFKRQEKAAHTAARAAANTGDDALRDEVEQGMQLFANQYQTLADKLDKLPSGERFDQLAARVDQMYAALDTTPDTPARSTATGGDGGAVQADC